MITAILGPMYSGKSTMLYQKMERYYYAGKSIALIRPKLDSRGYFSHSIENRSVERIIKASSKNKEIRVDEVTTTLCMELRAYDAVFIDEYFMIKGCSLEAKMSQSNQNVFFAGLIASSENKLFPETIELLPYCDEIIKLNGVCMICGSQIGNYSMYNETKTQEIDIGDTNKYKCVCRECYEREKSKL